MIEWKKERIWVLIAGVLEWAKGTPFASFSKEKRLDEQLANFFKNWGVPAKKLIYLQDKNCTNDAVRKAISHITEKIQLNENIFFYYCGHGHIDNQQQVSLAGFDAHRDHSLPAREIVEKLHQSKTQNLIFTADCCYSGGLADECEKLGSQRAAAITSAISSIVSTGSWTFSNALLAALKGEKFIPVADPPHICLKDLVAFIEKEMAIVDGQKAGIYLPEDFREWKVAKKSSAVFPEELGQIVYVFYNKKWYLARIIDCNETQYFVQYYSYLSDEKEWVDKNNVILYPKAEFALGEQVEVQIHERSKWYLKKWHPAQVLENINGVLFKIQLDDGEKITWVNQNQIRLPFKGKERSIAM